MSSCFRARLTPVITAASVLVLAACAGLPGQNTSAPSAPPATNESSPSTYTGVRERTRRITDEERARLSEHLIEQLRNGARASYVISIRIDDLEAYSVAVGTADIETGEDVGTRSLHRIASMTKPVTAAAIMMLVEDGALSLNDPLSDYFPAFAEVRVATELMAGHDGEIDTAPLERPITIEHLMTHTAGMGYGFDTQTDLGALWVENSAYAGDGGLAERVTRLANAPLYFQPGERWFYSFSNDVLGAVIEQVSGQSLEAFMQARIFQPLGMVDTSFFPTEEQRERLVALHTHGETGALIRVPDEDDPLRGADVETGGAGLYSTADDFIRFGQMLANGGVLGDVRILSEDSVAAMTAVHVGLKKMPAGQAEIGLAHGYSLGVVTPLADGGAPAGGIPGDFSWGGAFDTDFFVSPALGLVAVTLTQELRSPSTPSGGSSDQRAILYEIARD
ncbi:MAG: serine hydrolase domain-containing protein [Pseudomonadota bacterium]